MSTHNDPHTPSGTQPHTPSGSQTQQSNDWRQPHDQTQGQQGPDTAWMAHSAPAAQQNPGNGAYAQGPTYRVPGPEMSGSPATGPQIGSTQMPGPQMPGYPGAGPAGPTGPAGPGGYGPGSFGQRPAKRKKPLLKRWWFWIVAILVVVIIGSAISGGGDDATEKTDSSAVVAEDESASGEKAKEEPAAEEPAEEAAGASYGIGDAVAADEWEVTVNSVEDGVSSVGDEFLGAEAQGQFVVVDLSVKNTASAPDFFWEDNIKLGDEAGNTYSADSEAGLYADAESILFAEEINPGNTAKGVLVFDVPAEVSPDKLTFEGELFSDPIVISLG